MALKTSTATSCVDCGQPLSSRRAHLGPSGPDTCCLQCHLCYQQFFELYAKQQHQLAGQLSAAALQRHHNNNLAAAAVADEAEAMECDAPEDATAVLQMGSGSPGPQGSPVNNQHLAGSEDNSSSSWSPAAATSGGAGDTSSRLGGSPRAWAAPLKQQRPMAHYYYPEQQEQAELLAASQGMAALAAVGEAAYKAACGAEGRRSLARDYKQVLDRDTLEQLPRPTLAGNQLYSKWAALERFLVAAQACVGADNAEEEEVAVVQQTCEVLEKALAGVAPLPTPQPIRGTKASQQQDKGGRQPVVAVPVDAGIGLQPQAQQQQEGKAAGSSWPQAKRARTTKAVPRRGIPPPAPWAPTAWEAAAAAGCGSMMDWEEEHAVPVKQYFVKRTTARRPSSWEPAQGQAAPATAAPAAAPTSSMAPEGTTTASSSQPGSSPSLSGHKRGRNQVILPAATQQQQQEQGPSPAPVSTSLSPPATRRASCHPVVLPPAAVLVGAGAAVLVGPLSPTFSSLQGGGGAAAAGSTPLTAAAAAVGPPVQNDVEMAGSDSQEEGDQVEVEEGGLRGKRKRGDDEVDKGQQVPAKRPHCPPKRFSSQ